MKDARISLEHTLTRDELAAAGIELAQVAHMVVLCECERKEAMIDFKSRAEGLKSSVTILGEKLRTGKEERLADVRLDMDYDTQERVYHDPDTMRVVKRMPFQPGDQQAALPE